MSNIAESESPANPVGQSDEPIPGYKLIERIGLGGYGEVWKASAPGELTKALKFVYGNLSDERAQRELKSLERIKEVRHPFLLSLERIEVVDGRLIIVSELADSSLKDLLLDCQESGTTGIPRDQLLGYLRDAAEALDYICENHGLQHLDIKPDNLLLVGGRVKVADFGLVKELIETSASIVGGLTPVYASPEMFDGRPNRFTDQYSLAIVYQELLTGELPFQGRTAAQLAAQHLHSRPRLDALPASDRSVIGRALSKNPSKRFSNCCAMIDRLLNPEKRRNRASQHSGNRPSDVRATQSPRRAAASATNTVSLAGASADPDFPESSGIRIRPASEVPSLPPIKLSEASPSYEPTVFLGIGGTGTNVLRRLRRRLINRHGGRDSVLCMQLLALDTDVSELSEATGGDSYGTLGMSETLALPLKRTRDYRDNSELFLPWLSRRWLYNIPRSLQTEGMRPLGRLALVDHAEQVSQRISKAIRMATDAESVAESLRLTGLEFDAESVRVFIVASIAGGTGSGMVLDVGYLVRDLLSKAGFSDQHICGVLLHSTDRNTKRRDVAIANSVVCLEELENFSDATSHYPGDATLDLDSFNGPTFSNTYVTHLGDELSEDQYFESIDHVAEFLCQGAVTPASKFLDRCRHSENPEPSTIRNPQSMRTFGVRRVGLSETGFPETVANQLCHMLVGDWRGDLNVGATESNLLNTGTAPSLFVGANETEMLASIDQLAQEQVKHLRLDIGQIGQQLECITRHAMGNNAAAYVERLVLQLLGSTAQMKEVQDEKARIARALDGIDLVLGIKQFDGHSESPAFPLLESEIAEPIETETNELADKIGQWIYQIGDTSLARAKASLRALEWFSKYLRSASGQASEIGKAELKDAATIKKELLDSNDACIYWPQKDDSSKSSSDNEFTLNPMIVHYFNTMFCVLVMRSVSKLLGKLEHTHLSKLTDKHRSLICRLNELANEFQPLVEDCDKDTAVDGENELLDRFRAHARTVIQSNLSDLASETERRLLGDGEKLKQLLETDADQKVSLPQQLRSTARDVVIDALKRLNIVDAIIQSRAGAEENDRLAIQPFLESALPRLAGLATGKRLLAIAPESDEQEKVKDDLTRCFEEPLNVIFDSSLDVVFCYEMEGLSISDVAAAIVDDRIDLLQIASRLHARIDVEWSPLI